MSLEPFVGEIKILGFNFAPVGHAICSGQLTSIAQYSALYALIGTTYGGDGQQTFALPDFQGRMPIGQGPGLPNYVMGQRSGLTTTSILTSNIPPHVHTLNNIVVKQKASTANADETSPDGNYPANTTAASYSGNGPTNNTFVGGGTLSGTSDITGSGIPIDIMNPYLAINYAIALEGIFPSRN